MSKGGESDEDAIDVFHNRVRCRVLVVLMALGPRAEATSTCTPVFESVKRLQAFQAPKRKYMGAGAAD
jgi:hypothetical protein